MEGHLDTHECLQNNAELDSDVPAGQDEADRGNIQGCSNCLLLDMNDIPEALWHLNLTLLLTVVGSILL